MRVLAPVRQRGFALLAIALASCSSPPRAPASSCMQQTMDSLSLAGLSNDRQHCLASGSIALRCGPATAWLAGYGKEVADAFGPGQVQQRDLRANAAGRSCASQSASEQDLAGCCADAGF